jgi:hypothetical protein
MGFGDAPDLGLLWPTARRQERQVGAADAPHRQQGGKRLGHQRLGHRSQEPAPPGTGADPQGGARPQPTVTAAGDATMLSGPNSPVRLGGAVAGTGRRTQTRLPPSVSCTPQSEAIA